MKKLLAILAAMSMLLCMTALAENAGAVCAIDATNLTVELPESWSVRELMPTDVVNGVLLVAFNADESVSLDAMEEHYTAEEMQAKMDAGAKTIDINGIPFVLEETSNDIWYYMTDLTETSVLTFTVYADAEAFAANKEALEQLFGSLALSADAAKSGNKYHGTVISFNSGRGYGYILANDGTKIFVHYTGLNMNGIKRLEAGQRVSFNIIDGARGLQATNVTID